MLCPLPCPNPAGESSLPGMLPCSHKLPLDLHTLQPDHDEDILLQQVRPAAQRVPAGCMQSLIDAAGCICECKSQVWWWALSTRRL